MKHQIEKSYLISTSRDKVWDALVNPVTIQKWSNAPVQMSDKVDTDFSLWDGDIYGTNTDVVPGELLVQDWYGGDWDRPSKVTFTLAEAGGKTNVVLTQDELAEKDIHDFDSGWDDYYLGSIKEYLEK